MVFKAGIDIATSVAIIETTISISIRVNPPSNESSLIRFFTFQMIFK